MIRHDALHSMMLLETAAANWFARMTPKERQTYVASHPRSKYAKNSGGVLAGQAHRLSTKSTQMHNSHARKAAAGGPNAAMHARIAAHHDVADEHFRAADQHFENGDHKAGQKALQAGLGASKKATDLHAKMKSQRGDERAINRASREYHRQNPDVLKRAKTPVGEKLSKERNARGISSKNKPGDGKTSVDPKAKTGGKASHTVQNQKMMRAPTAKTSDGKTSVKNKARMRKDRDALRQAPGKVGRPLAPIKH